MSKTITASERANIIRYAATLPKGDATRRAIITAVSNSDSHRCISVGTRVMVPDKYTVYGTHSNIGTVDTVYADGVTTRVRLPAKGGGKPGYYGFTEVTIPMAELKRASGKHTS